MSPTATRRLVIAACSLLVLTSPIIGALLAEQPVQGLILGASAIPTGRYIVLSQGLAPGVDAPLPVLAFLAICCESGLAGLVAVASQRVLFKLPLVGRGLRRIRDRLSNRSPRKAPIAAFFALLLFVITPVPGSGAIGGAVLGRVLGMRLAAIMGAVALGTAISVLILAFGVAGVDALLAPLEDPDTVVVVRTGVIVGLLASLAAVGALLGRSGGKAGSVRPPDRRTDA